MSQDFYLGNPNLKKVGTDINFTQDQVQEYLKCKEDPVYFARNYIKIISLDEGIVPFDMWDFQEELIESFHEHRFNIAKLPRQTGKSTTCVCHTYFIMFFSMTTLTLVFLQTNYPLLGICLEDYS